MYITELTTDQLSVCGILFFIKNELQKQYEDIDCQKIIEYLNFLENKISTIRFDMDYLIKTLEDEYNISKLFVNSSYQKQYIEFCERNIFIRTGWMSSSRECGDDDDYESDCNWKSSTEECEGTQRHYEYYCELTRLVFEE